MHSPVANGSQEKLARRVEVAPEYLVLVYSGKILKDENTAEFYGIAMESILHLVIKVKPTPPQIT
jgi:hypothetical protein